MHVIQFTFMKPVIDSKSYRDRRNTASESMTRLGFLGCTEDPGTLLAHAASGKNNW